MTNQEAKMAWAEGKKLKYQRVNWSDGRWVPLDRENRLALFDDPGFQFRIVQEPVVLECVVENRGVGKAIYCDEKVITRCYNFGIDPPLGAKVKLTVEVE